MDPATRREWFTVLTTLDIMQFAACAFAVAHIGMASVTGVFIHKARLIECILGSLGSSSVQTHV